MSENATETVAAATPELTQAQKDEMFKTLPGEFQDAIAKLNTEISGHNSKVDSIKAADAQDPKLIKAEIFEQSDNKKLSRLYNEYLKVIAQAEAIKDQAYQVIDTDGLMPKDLSEAEVEKLKTDVTESTKDLRDQVGALLKFEEMMPAFKNRLAPHISEIKTRRGAAKTGPSGAGKGEGTKRLRFKKIEINDVTQDDRGNHVWQTVAGEEKYTFTFAAQYLKKQHKSIDWTANDLTKGYLSGVDENNLPDEHTFEMPFTFKDGNGNDQTVTYRVKAYR